MLRKAVGKKDAELIKKELGKFSSKAIARGYDAAFEPALRGFVYLPFEHSEDMADQDRAVALFDALGDETYARYARAHRDVIERFGRFPHRNVILGRETTPEEAAYLAAGGYAG